VFGYDDFGNEMYNQRNEQPFTYTGYQKDDVTGTLFAQAREYQPTVGRFVSEDLVKGYVLATQTLNQYTYCWNDPMNLVDLDGLFPTEPRQEPENDARYVIFVHGTVIQPWRTWHSTGTNTYGPDQWGEAYINHVINSLNVSENNVHIPNWRGRNNPRERVRGGNIVEGYIRNILSNNPNAEILIIGYSHGGNVVKIALNNIFSDDYELDLSNVTMVGTATPALREYQLNNVQGLNNQFNFYNIWDATQANYAGIGSSTRRQDPSGTLWRPSDQWGRAQYTAHPENNIRVTRDVPRNSENLFGAAAHTIMMTSQTIWDLYKVEPIRESKGW